jgi:Spy/CpxP family protein refolding chaperone
MKLKSLLPAMLLAASIATVSASPPGATQSSSNMPGTSAHSETKKDDQASLDTVKKARLTRLKNQVGLKADQEAKAKAIIDKYVDDRAVAKSDTKKLDTLKSKFDSDINAILTPAQRTKLAASNAATAAKGQATKEKAALEKAAASPSPKKP